MLHNQYTISTNIIIISISHYYVVTGQTEESTLPAL